MCLLRKHIWFSCISNNQQSYRKLFTKNKKNTTVAAAASDVKSFYSIPGPLSLPLIGTLYQYFPLVGKYRFDKLHINGLKKYKKFGPIIREEIFPGQNIVWLYDPKDIEIMFRTEGPFPSRKSHLALEKYRLDRPHIYTSGGLLPTNGTEWARIRRIFQKGLSGPTDVLTFLRDSDSIIQEWLNNRIDIIHKNANLDYLPELSRLFLELFDSRMYCYYGHELLPNSRTTKLLEAAFVTNSQIIKTDNGPHLWKMFETPAYRRLKKAQEFMQRYYRKGIL